MKRLVPCLAVGLVLLMPLVALAQDPDSKGKSSLPDAERAMVASFVACAVAFVTAISILGSAYAVAHVGSAAIGAASEKPEMMVRGLMFVALAEGLAIIGIVIAFALNTALGKLVS